MKPGELVLITIDNYDGGMGLLLEEGEGFRMCRVLIADGTIENYFTHELSALGQDPAAGEEEP